MKSTAFAAVFCAVALWSLSAVPASAQFTEDLHFSLEFGPTVSWLKSNSGEIDGAGSTVGFRFLLLGEKYFGTNYAFFGGAGMSFGQGGTLKYKVGGNFLPNSDHSDPDLY